MKKLLILFLLCFLCSCTCLLSQIPPQKIYTGASCSAILPDYRLKIIASDNCEIASFTQIPAPGFILNSVIKTTSVTIKATDASGNFRQIVFTVTLLDTIKPVLTIDPVLLSYQTEQINDIYNFGDKLVEQASENLIKQEWIDTFPGLREKLIDSAFYKQMLVVTSTQRQDGNRRRFISFADSVGLFYKVIK